MKLIHADASNKIALRTLQKLVRKHKFSVNSEQNSRRQSSPSPPSVCTAIEVDTRRAKSVGRSEFSIFINTVYLKIQICIEKQ